MSIEDNVARVAYALERLAAVAEVLIRSTAQQTVVDPPAPPPAVVTVGTIPQQAPPPRRGRPPKVTTEQAPPAAIPAAATATAPAEPAPATPGASPSVYAQLADAINLLANAPGKLQKAIAILESRHGAKRVSELKPDEYAGVLAEVKAALAQQSLI